MAMTFSYRAYELNLSLPFPCPALPAAAADAEPDVVVAEGAVPRRLPAPVAEGISWQAEPGRYLLRAGRRAGRFLVEGGGKVTLERNPAAEDEVLSLHFLDTVLAAVLRQRGLLVLHANTAATPRGAIAVSGESGAGKSTTLAGLLARGCAMLADDITAVRLGQGNRVEALPGVPQMHLTEDAAEALGKDVAGLPRQLWRRVKAAIPVNVASESAPLRALYLLTPCTCNQLQCRELCGAEKFAALQECIYGPLLPQEHPGQFPLFAAVAEQVAVFRLQRPAGRWTADDIAEVLLRG